MTEISNSRKILGLSILVGGIFYILNGIQDLIIMFDFTVLVLLIAVGLIIYIVGFVIILKQPYLPKPISERIKKVI